MARLESRLEMPLYSQEDYEADIEYLESERGRVRQLVIAAAEPNNPWRIDGLEAKRRDDILLSLIADCDQRRKTTKFVVSRAIEERKNNPKPKKGGQEAPRRTKYGHMWQTVPQERATLYKQKGFEVRFIGIGWQVKIS